jgi:hypothetical protein
MLQHFAPDIAWDATAIGVTGKAGGLHELAAWYRDWMGLWESYVSRMVEIREVDGWIPPRPTCARGAGAGSSSRCASSSSGACATARWWSCGPSSPTKRRWSPRPRTRADPLRGDPTASTRLRVSSRCIIGNAWLRAVPARRPKDPPQHLRVGRGARVSVARGPLPLRPREASGLAGCGHRVGVVGAYRSDEIPRARHLASRPRDRLCAAVPQLTCAWSNPVQELKRVPRHVRRCPGAWRLRGLSVPLAARKTAEGD